MSHRNGRVLALCLLLVVCARCVGQSADPRPATAPPAAEIEAMLQKEPLSLETWPAWRDRALAWYFDRSGHTEGFDKKLLAFIATQAKPDLSSPKPPLDTDPLAWILLVQHRFEALTDPKPPQPAQDINTAYDSLLPQALKDIRHAVELAPDFAPAHAALASFLIESARSKQKTSAPETSALLDEAEREIANAARLDRSYLPSSARARVADVRGQNDVAEREFKQAMQESPEDPITAGRYLQFLIQSEQPRESYASLSEPIALKFADNGEIQTLHALALARDSRMADAAAALEQARKLGHNPATMIGAEGIAAIERQARLEAEGLGPALLALKARKFDEALTYLRPAARNHLDDPQIARLFAHALLASQQNADGTHQSISPEISELCSRFPNDGELRAVRAVAYNNEGRFRDAAHDLDQAAALGFKTTTFLEPADIKQIQDLGGRGWGEMILLALLGFAAVYALVMLAMAGIGTLLALATRKRNYLSQAPVEDQFGTPELVDREPWIAKLYIAVLLLGIILFYVSIPFVVVGIFAGMLGALWLVFQLPQIPVKLLLIILLAGLGMVWAVLKSIFTSPGREAFGIKKDENEAPRLHAALRDVAQRTETRPIDDVYLTPTSGIGVRQDGRGPFGMFGVKRRVLSLGLATLHDLSISELKAILAHEYGHFSHRDTFYSRFIYQVTMSIETALQGMGQSGGKLNYINPFFWFFYLYHRAYTMLSAGFSRSREFLADRMAVRLYGKRAFISGLSKAIVEGSLFDKNLAKNVGAMVQDSEMKNFYEAFRAHRDNELTAEEREAHRREALNESHSLFATHPTYEERLDAVASFPDLPETEPAPASSLLQNPQAIEEELTEYYLGRVRMLQAMYFLQNKR